LGRGRRRRGDILRMRVGHWEREKNNNRESK